jgi:Spy/CpxP family protein refolding chaperone
MKQLDPVIRLSLTATLLVLSALPACAQHQHSPYAGMQDRDIKALSVQQIEDLREGRGMGASLPAELNGVPGPIHVLQLKEQLGVTPEQMASLEQITASMKVSAQQLGKQVIEAERELDVAFRSRVADEQRIRDISARIGALSAELRTVHLLAHLKTKQVLTDQQVAAYNDARGYSAPADAHRDRH